MTLIKKIYLSVAIFGIFTALLIGLLIYPLFKGISKSSEDFIAQRNKFYELEAKIENSEKLKETYKTYQPNLEKLNNLFVDFQVPIDFINFLEENARDSQLKFEISSMAREESQKAKDALWPRLSFQGSATGSFSNFLKFLEKLENSSYLIEVENLTLKRLTEKEAALSDVNANFLLKVYTK